ncbi:hypothetical protein NBO_62g0014 [Nosema bombycis CQ1]|uniref:Uncharacterized protein n=1 Tax=Nosema bombycis (strain CQ1 / CVCC 102059) TaxID=578461 RepID=R0M6U5_NOSB1|nr:hypothetical protein NBO_62g0014 [Nosema bombycis CQ1]|eukprot:EOB13724.1 hypothetical protein NBO_62g0014 [Nosema bombycis CQ1]
MYSIKSRASVNTVSASFYRYLLDLFRRYESFSDVPNSSILITRDFLDYKKCLLKYYFNDKRVGFKETLDSLNERLSQINKKEDISDQLNSFINDRRTNLLRKNDCFAGFESLRSKCSNVEFELTSLLIDTLTLLKSYTEEKSESTSYSSLDNQNIYVVIKEVKVFEMPDTIRRKKGSKLQLEIDSNENLDSFIGKDIWFLKNRLYISQNFCNNCCEWNWFLEVFNAKEKTKKMLLELFTPII